MVVAISALITATPTELHRRSAAATTKFRGRRANAAKSRGRSDAAKFRGWRDATRSEVCLTAKGLLGEARGRHRHWQNQGHCGSGTQNLKTDHDRLHLRDTDSVSYTHLRA